MKNDNLKMISYNEMKKLWGGEIISLRRSLHENAEPSGAERKTTELIARAFAPLAMERLPLPVETGAAFRLRGGRTGETVLMRADIDALAVAEPAGNEPRSMNAGAMHACGHDVHAAGLYGAALALSHRRESIRGDVIFLFQPAEETTEGARAILNSGFFEREGVSAAFALHNMPDMPVGEIGIASGPVMAAKDSFEITIRGKGGHGAMPETANDPIVAAAGVICALQTVVSRGISPLESAALTVASIHGGSTDNRIEDLVSLRGSIRSLGTETEAAILKRCSHIVRHCAEVYGCEGEFTLTGGVPAVINDEKLLPRCAAAAAAAGKQIPARPVMISEDFAHYGSRVPVFFAFLGSGIPGTDNAPLHSAAYCAHEDAPLYGAAYLANIVE